MGTLSRVTVKCGGWSTYWRRQKQVAAWSSLVLAQSRLN